MDLSHIQIVVASQVNITVQPVNAEAYDSPAKIAYQCKKLADEEGKPVNLIDKEGYTCTFNPETPKQAALTREQQARRDEYLSERDRA